MEILQHGNKENKITACACGCRFKYDEEDIKHETDNGGVFLIVNQYVNCPECGLRITTDVKTIEGEELKCLLWKTAWML